MRLVLSDGPEGKYGHLQPLINVINAKNMIRDIPLSRRTTCMGRVNSHKAYVAGSAQYVLSPDLGPGQAAPQASFAI